MTGGAGTICSVQTKAMVYLGANACIIGRNVEKTESKAKEIAAVRKGAKVIGIGAVDVRNVSVLMFCQMTYHILTKDYSSTASKAQSTAVSRSWAK